MGEAPTSSGRARRPPELVYQDPAWFAGRALSPRARGGLRGTYHYVSRNYLQGYLNEFTFRLNHKNDVVPMFRTMLLRAASAR